MRHLYGKKIILTCLLCLFGLAGVMAQSARGNYNFLDFQQKPYYFGITLASNSSKFKVFRSNDFILNDSISLTEPVNGPGFNLGIVTNLKLGDNFDIRFLPTLSFAERNIRFAAPGDGRPPYQRKIESVFVELPFHVRYKSAPYNDLRMFVIGGIKYSFDVASDSRARQADELVKIAPTDFAIEVGAGVQFFFPYFIFSPEFKISQGISSILIFNQELIQSNVIDKLLSRTFTISLH
ncbi:MAG: outer membrane beta-barrel protein [Bacteroidota bacterium]